MDMEKIEEKPLGNHNSPAEEPNPPYTHTIDDINEIPVRFPFEEEGRSEYREENDNQNHLKGDTKY